MRHYYDDGEKIYPKNEQVDRLEYYRPRGAQGNYKATLKLQYISSETIEVL